MGAFIALSEGVNGELTPAFRQVAIDASGCALLVFAGLSFLPTFRTSANSILFNSLGYSLSVVILGGLWFTRFQMPLLAATRERRNNQMTRLATAA